LGVTRVVPLRTQYAVVQPASQALTRLRRIVVEASKQCGRNRLMQIGEAQDWPAFVERSAGVKCRLLAQAAGLSQGTASAHPGRVAGPRAAGRWTRGRVAGQEVTQAVVAGWHTVDLGPRILRIETAAVVLAR